MFDRGHVFRRFTRLPTHFASQNDAPVGAPRQFRSTEHLSTEAVAAYADGELRLNAHMRAATHLGMCPACAAEVDAQRQARKALRDSLPIDLPTSLVGRLSQIPYAAFLEPGDPGDDGASRLADDATRDRRRRR